MLASLGTQFSGIAIARLRFGGSGALSPPIRFKDGSRMVKGWFGSRCGTGGVPLRDGWGPAAGRVGSRCGTGGVPLWDGSISGLVPLWDALALLPRTGRAAIASKLRSYSTVAPFAHFRSPTAIKMPSATNSLQVRIIVERPSSVSSAIVCFEHHTPRPSSLARSARYAKTPLRTDEPKTREYTRDTTLWLIGHPPSKQTFRMKFCGLG